MCLISSKPPQTATEDITCYKLVFYKNETYYPAYGTLPESFIPYSNWPTITPSEMSMEIEPVKLPSGAIKYGPGYIHARREPRVDFYVEAIVSLNPTNFRFFKCIIPKGTEYLIDDNNKDICARKMIAIEVWNMEGEGSWLKLQPNGLKQF